MPIVQIDSRTPKFYWRFKAPLDRVQIRASCLQKAHRFKKRTVLIKRSPSRRREKINDADFYEHDSKYGTREKIFLAQTAVNLFSLKRIFKRRPSWSTKESINYPFFRHYQARVGRTPFNIHKKFEISSSRTIAIFENAIKRRKIKKFQNSHPKRSKNSERGQFPISLSFSNFLDSSFSKTGPNSVFSKIKIGRTAASPTLILLVLSEYYFPQRKKADFLYANQSEQIIS